MIVVTSGSKYLDIDAYAGIIAYAQLLTLQGKPAVAASSALLNSSVVECVQDTSVELTTYRPTENDSFVLIDISNREFLDTFVKEKNVIEVIDHHPGHEAFWRAKLGDKAQIETVGAACTMVYERWEKSPFVDQMDPLTAKMLAAGILDNTLNFTAAISGKRDVNAYKELIKIVGVEKDFAKQYFSDTQKAIEVDLEQAIKNDLKIVTETNLLPRLLAQLAVWDTKDFISKNMQTMTTLMNTLGDDWAINIISVSEGKTILVAANKISQDKLTSLLGGNFQNGVSSPYQSMLRKEMAKKALS